MCKMIFPILCDTAIHCTCSSGSGKAFTPYCAARPSPLVIIGVTCYMFYKIFKSGWLNSYLSICVIAYKIIFSFGIYARKHVVLHVILYRYVLKLSTLSHLY